MGGRGREEEGGSKGNEVGKEGEVVLGIERNERN